jgi:hypothetical protein
MKRKSRYTREQIELLNQYYQSGLNRIESCKLANIPVGAFSYLMKRFNLQTRPSGFQKGNHSKTQFKKGIQVELTCPICDKVFSVPNWDAQRGRRCCSRKCHSSFKNKGLKHWNWKGGISNRWDKIHNSLEYKQWRLSVWQRDFFHCQLCSQSQNRNNPLHAHHIFPKKDYPDMILDINNGITLCRGCHKNIHRGRHG